MQQYDTVRILNVEDNEDDFLLLKRHLKKSSFGCELAWVDSKSAFLQAIESQNWDLIISDYSMPSLSGLHVLQALKDRSLDIPVIIMSGAVGEELAVETMRNGARDFILKNSRSRLLPAIEREVVEARHRSEKQFAEQALNKQHAVLRLAEDAAQVGSWAYEPSTGQFIWSRSTKSLYQIKSRSPSISIDAFLNIFVEEDRSDFILSIQKSLTELSPFCIKHRILNDDGEVKWFESRGQPFRNKHGKNTLVGVSIDITDHVESLLELRKSKEQAEKSDRLKTAFLANISHELRTPLNAIIGLANLLQEDVTDQEESMHWAKVIFENGNHLLDLINDIVDSAKIESGEMKAEPSCFDLHSFLEQVRESFSADPKLKELEGLFLELPQIDQKTPPKRTVYTDHRRLRQVLLNLIRNAIKFTDSGRITFGYIDDDESYLHFYVRDTGIGIPGDKQEIIFERFRQIDQKFNRDFQGAGLGLSISQGLVELLGGNLSVDSQVDVGSTFSFSIPCLKIPDLSELESQ
ncbi:ATP-binding response regulator [Pelagicoccus mobilis]|uniref:histidine kinase n=1 Tax=Pelagicoccus mobilis TaxID=415221 RepID=A0A934RV72_9BACT|nr:response regulator [Pelagicoccus mobilis]MBK1877061.1 response regulator [Pelagicoccus mobilis]